MPPQPKKKQQVRFAETATVVVVRKCNYHYENWYRKGEVRAFKRDIEKACLAKADPYSKVMKSVGYCVQQGTVSPNFAVEDEIRGLEHLLSPDVARVLIQHRQRTIDQVLKEQERQLLCGEYDADKIASVSKQNSRFVVELRRRIAEL